MIDLISSAVDLCEIMHEETEFKKLAFSRARLAEFLNQVNVDENSLFCINRLDDKAVSIFVGQVYPHIYTDDLFAVDQILYVHPEYRRNGFARISIENYKMWAKSKGAKMILLGSSTGFDGAEGFFKSCDFERVGGNYTLRGV